MRGASQVIVQVRLGFHLDCSGSHTENGGEGAGEGAGRPGRRGGCCINSGKRGWLLGLGVTSGGG